MPRPNLNYGIEYTGNNIEQIDAELNSAGYTLSKDEGTGRLMVFVGGIPGFTYSYPLGTIFTYGCQTVYNPDIDTDNPFDKMVEVPVGRYRYGIVLDNEES